MIPASRLPAAFMKLIRELGIVDDFRKKGRDLAGCGWVA